MGTQYHPIQFFREVSIELFQRYFQKLKIAECLRVDTKRAVLPTETLEAIDALLAGKRERLDADFSLVTDMSTDAASTLIQSDAAFMRRKWAPQLSDMKNGHERAFLVLLEDRELLHILAGQSEMDRFSDGQWSRRNVGTGLKPETDAEAIARFKVALQSLLKEEGRGKRCHIDHCERDAPHRHCYFAYPEDLPKTDPGYNDENEFGRQVRRNALELIFAYHPQSGRMEMIAPGHAPKREALAAAFCSTILKLPTLPPPTKKTPVNLDVLRDPKFQFVTEPADNVDRVELRMLRFDVPGTGKRRLTVSATPRKTDSETVIHEVVDAVVAKSSIPLPSMKLTQAKIAIKFKRTESARAKTLVFDVTHPDRFNLKDHAHDLVAKKYLKKWGITHE